MPIHFLVVFGCYATGFICNATVKVEEHKWLHLLVFSPCESQNIYTQIALETRGCYYTSANLHIDSEQDPSLFFNLR